MYLFFLNYVFCIFTLPFITAKRNGQNHWDIVYVLETISHAGTDDVPLNCNSYLQLCGKSAGTSAVRHISSLECIYYPNGQNREHLKGIKIFSGSKSRGYILLLLVNRIKDLGSLQFLRSRLMAVSRKVFWGIGI